MAHDEQLAFFSKVIELFPEKFMGAVIDIGSFDINGGPHRLIAPSEYVGVDLSEGPNVTLVSGGQDVDLASNRFDVAMSSECFEHNPYWIATFQNMIRMTKPGGIVVFSTGSTGRPVHGTSDSDGGHAAPAAVTIGQEFYRNVEKKSVARAFEATQFQETWMGYNPISADLYFVGIKARALDSPRIEKHMLAEVALAHRRNVLKSVASIPGLAVIVSRFGPMALRRVGLGWLASGLVWIVRTLRGTGKAA